MPVFVGSYGATGSGSTLSGRTFILYTKQNKPIVTTQVLWVRHYATYFRQIDDEASKRVGDTRVSLTRQATGRDTIVIGFVGEKDINNLPSHWLCFEDDARIGRR
jgi:hypothetical protein